MPKTPEPYVIYYRKDSRTYNLTLNPNCGLPRRVCLEWRRRSFQHLPDELAEYRSPKSMAEAKIGKDFLIAFLKRKQEEGSARNTAAGNVTVGEWIRRFTDIETSPRTGINASKNRPYSVDTFRSTYNAYYTCHIQGDPFTELRMAEVEEDDVLDFCTRMSIDKLLDGRPMGGTRTYKGVLGLVRMAFRFYQRKNHNWINPFTYLDPPKYESKTRDALPEEEMMKLFSKPGILEGAMETGVCAAIFLGGLRRSEVFALRPEDLDWATPKITVRRSWQMFDYKDRVMGPPKGKKPRETHFDPILQAAIKKLWEENGSHEYVFSFRVKDKNGKTIGGKTPGPAWIRGKFPKWLERAGIELGGREIVPHSSRHSLATLLYEKGVPIQHIQELLGHSDIETTKIYLHTSGKTIQAVKKTMSSVMDENKIIDFKVS